MLSEIEESVDDNTAISVSKETLREFKSLLLLVQAEVGESISQDDLLRLLMKYYERMTEDILKPVRVKLLDETEVHDSKHDNALNEMEDVQRQISQIWESITALLSRIEEIEKTADSSEDENE